MPRRKTASPKRRKFTRPDFSKLPGWLWRFTKKLLKVCGVLLLVFVVVSCLSVLAYRWLPVKVTPLMLIRKAQGVTDASGSWQHEWVPLDSISPYLPVAVMASEDQNFLKHNGFDYRAILDAYEEAQAGGRVRGASTISQQTAKNVFLWPNSSWIRKGFETYFTVLIEWMWPKRRIMEVYLNSIEMGPGIYGAEAVAQEHFGCHARELSRSQCALIAATLPNPLRYSSKNPSPYMQKRRRQIGIQMKHIDFLPPKSEDEEEAEGSRTKK